MKTSRALAITAITATLLLAYPAAAWFSGTQIEARVQEWHKKSEQFPNIKVVKHDYKRGVFSSTEDAIVQISLAGIMPNTVADTEGAISKPVTLHFINHIKHGPLPGLRSFGSALVESELVFDPAIKAEIEKIFGQQNPLEIVTKLNYGGGGTTTIVSPAFNAKVGEKQDQVAWKGLKLSLDFSAHYTELKFKMSAPGLVANAHDGDVMTVGAIDASADLRQAYPDSFLYLGKTTSSVEHINVNNSAKADKVFSLQKLVLDSDTTSRDDLMDKSIKFGAQKLVLGKDEYSELHYDYSLRRLHGPTLVKFIEAAYKPAKSEISADPMADVLKPLKEFGPLLLQYKPELTIDRISVVTPEGEAKISAKVNLTDTAKIDENNLMLLLTMITASADISIPEAMLGKFGASPEEPEMQAMMQEGMKKQVVAFEQAGYINRIGKLLTSKIEWKDGQLSVNGKPFAMPH
ncbi:MAG: YdgA family protein [Pseudomonadota bacterium]